MRSARATGAPDPVVRAVVGILEAMGRLGCGSVGYGMVDGHDRVRW